MFVVMLFMLAGLAVGLAMRGRDTRFVRITTTALVWVLLFLLGIEVGGNPDVTGSFANLGIEALAIAVAGVLGSVMLAWLLYSVVTKHNKKNSQ